MTEVQTRTVEIWCQFKSVIAMKTKVRHLYAMAFLYKSRIVRVVLVRCVNLSVSYVR